MMFNNSVESCFLAEKTMKQPRQRPIKATKGLLFLYVSRLPYLGSTCVELSASGQYKWSMGKCSQEKRFVCERGLSGIIDTSYQLYFCKAFDDK